MNINSLMTEVETDSYIKSIFEDLCGGPLVCASQIMRLQDSKLRDTISYSEDATKQFVLETMIESTEHEPWENNDPLGKLKSQISWGVIRYIFGITNK